MNPAFTQFCPICGADYAVVGRVHFCRGSELSIHQLHRMVPRPGEINPEPLVEVRVRNIAWSEPEDPTNWDSKHSITEADMAPTQPGPVLRALTETLQAQEILPRPVMAPVDVVVLIEGAPRRGKGRPPGSKNKPKPPGWIAPRFRKRDPDVPPEAA